jgi:uncharacterized membrane protein
MLFEIWEDHKGKITGIISGIFLSVVYLISGFWDMVMCGFLVLLGYYIGKKWDKGEPWIDFSGISNKIYEIWRKIR